MRLSDKIALVTGSSRGIGKSIAIRLAREGADVAIHYNSSVPHALEVAAEVEAAGRRAHLVQADVARVSEVQRLVAESVAHFGRLDILVNNAGIERKAAFCDVTEEDYDLQLAVDLKAAFFGTQAFVRQLLASKRPGKVINISSVHEDLPFPGFAPYCASKGGVRMLTRTLAVELRGTGITINGVAPGAIETDINRAQLADPRKRDELTAKVPLGRMGRPEDVAGVVAFLASSDADYITGTTTFVDGGLTWFYEEQ